MQKQKPICESNHNKRPISRSSSPESCRSSSSDSRSSIKKKAKIDNEINRKIDVETNLQKLLNLLKYATGVGTIQEGQLAITLKNYQDVICRNNVINYKIKKRLNIV